MNIAKFLARAAAIFAVAASAHAAPITATVNAPVFTLITGTFNQGARISGSITFDSSMLDAAGSGYVSTYSGAINPGITWSFTDGLNTFNNANTLYNFAIVMGFANFAPTYWNIDTTYGVTPWADIFLYSPGANVSYHQEDYAVGPNATASDWVVTRAGEVPEPGSLALIGLGLAGAAALRRRKA